MPAAKSPRSPKAKSPRAKGSRKQTVTGAQRAGTVFAPARCSRELRNGRYSERMARSAGAFMAGVLQYISEELCELAGDMAGSRGRKTIAPQDLNLAMRSDPELAKLMHMC